MNCQSPKDTICISYTDAQNCVICKLQKRLLDSVVVTLKANNEALNNIVASYRAKDSANTEIINTLYAQQSGMAQQRAALEAQIAILTKEAAKQRTLKKLVGIGGIALSLIITGLFILK